MQMRQVGAGSEEGEEMSWGKGVREGGLRTGLKGRGNGG